MEEMKKRGSLWDANLDTEKRLEWLLTELTLDEKLHMLSSGAGGVERLGIPNCRLGGEAAHGVEARNDQNGIGKPEFTTSFPQPIGMSSSWDQETIRDAGEIVGKEARLVYEKHPWGGISRWAPTVDLLRDPRWGRNEEAYGEDPVQVGAMASAYVRGMQGDDERHLVTASTLKHFYANNTEIGRGWKNVSMSPRNKYELYLEPFRRCIEDGRVEGVMTAYNRINGVQGLFNEEVKNLLKEEFGLTHAVSDGGAMELSASYSHATAMDAETAAMSIKAGVDAISGRPDAVYAAASEAYELGLLTEEDIDTAIKNVYRTKIKLGLFDEGAQKRDYGVLCGEEAKKICKTLTDKSVVLLKNDGILPLEREDLSDCVLIGPVGDKWYRDWYGGEAPERITLQDGLKEQAAKKGLRELTYLDGCDRISLKCGEDYLSADEEGRYRLSKTPEVFVLEDWGEESYTLRNETTGTYMITNLADDAVEGFASPNGTTARITGKVCVGKDRIFSWFDLEVFRMCEAPATDERAGGIIMQDRFGNGLYADKEGFIVTAGELHEGLTPLCFEIQTISNGVDLAVEAASKTGKVVLALGHNPMVNAKEEIDRATIAFIPYQQRLFDRIYKVNPNVIVVLMSDYPFAVGAIDKEARAILWSATGSQCMGRSLADALVGEFSPAGRLTQTWYGADEDLPDMDDYDVIGKGRTYRYFEGEVLYPFGYGLTYTQFVKSDLKLSIVHGESLVRNGVKHKKTFGQPCGVYDRVRMDDRALKVELTITNEGGRISDEVVQIYATALQSSVKRPRKQLIGFTRLKEVAPGEARRVELLLPVRELAFYDMVSESLIVEAGDYRITAASSSGDEGISGVITVEGDTPGLRDLAKRIKADHFDETIGSQIVQGTYGFSALMAEGPSVYEPPVDGCFSASYANCKFPENSKTLRLHGRAPEDAVIKVFVDDCLVADLTLNTRDYDKNAAPSRNHMPRAEEADAKRKLSFPLLWADIRIPLELDKVSDLSVEKGHIVKIEAKGPFTYDWFMVN